MCEKYWTLPRILLENYYLQGQLELSIGEFVEYYNNQRNHESLDNLTPVDVYFGRGPAILSIGVGMGPPRIAARSNVTRA
jgi:transposase InsO family protein